MNHLYEKIEVIYENQEKKLILVRHSISQTLYIKKIVPLHSNRALYQQLKAHPHPYMANVLDCYEEDDHLIIIEEYVNGVSLEYEMSTHTLQRTQITEILHQLCEVLIHLHQLTPPIIHRDIKPSNIMIDKGMVKLIDFDIARLLSQTKKRDTQLLGTQGYAAPEQFGFLESDQRSDIYALGVCMEELYQDCGVDAHLAHIIKKCKQLDPEQRYQSVEALWQAMKPKNEGPWFQQLPGFGKESRGKRIAYGVYYLFICFFIWDCEFQQPSLVQEILMKISAGLMFFLIPIVYTNAFHVREISPWYHAKSKVVRIINGCLIYLFLLFSEMIICILLSSIAKALIS